MLTRLRDRKVPYRGRTEARRSGPRWSPILYMLAVAGLLLWGADAVFGHMVYFRADGLVVAEPTATATEFTATVEAVMVDRGDEVTEGQVIARLSSLEVSERIGELTLRNAENRADLQELAAGRTSLPGLLEAANDRRAAAELRLEKIRQAVAEGIATGPQLADAHDDYYRALAEARELEARLLNLEDQIAAVTLAIESGDEALASLRERYDDGRLVAPVSGVVGDVNVAEGDVVQPGESLLEIYSGPLKVLGFLPSSTLYDLAPGDRVSVHYGIKESAARIESIEPVAPELPEEFQKTFRPVERQQLAYIRFEDPATAPPLFSKVRLGSHDFPPDWLKRLFGSDRVAAKD